MKSFITLLVLMILTWLIAPCTMAQKGSIQIKDTEYILLNNHLNLHGSVKYQFISGKKNSSFQRYHSGYTFNPYLEVKKNKVIDNKKNEVALINEDIIEIIDIKNNTGFSYEYKNGFLMHTHPVIGKDTVAIINGEIDIKLIACLLYAHNEYITERWMSFFTVDYSILTRDYIGNIKQFTANEFLENTTAKDKGEITKWLTYFESEKFDSLLINYPKSDNLKSIDNQYLNKFYEDVYYINAYQVGISNINTENFIDNYYFNRYVSNYDRFRSKAQKVNSKINELQRLIDEEAVRLAKQKREQEREQEEKEEISKWLEENEFKYAVHVKIKISNFECKMCYAECQEFDIIFPETPDFSTLPNSELANEIYKTWANSIYLKVSALTLLEIEKCTKDICPESVTGKTKHAWKKIDEKTVEQTFYFENPSSE